MSLVVRGGEPKKIELEDDLHTGKLTKIEERKVDGADYAYLDVFIQPSGKDFELKVGYPLPKEGESLNENMRLGKLVERFTGEDIVKDKDYDLEQLLVGKVVKFMSMTNKKGFVEIQKDSVKPGGPGG